MTEVVPEAEVVVAVETDEALVTAPVPVVVAEVAPLEVELMQLESAIGRVF